jgi:prophage DNA circulation protein
MSWKDRLKQASFRGVNFYVLESERESGIHTVVQELLPDDTDVESQGIVYVEDFGQGLDTFSIEGYIIANAKNNYDYMPDRDALIEALRVRKQGILSHPYYGDIEVYLVGRARIKESNSEGGIARFSMQFVQFNELPPPSKTIAADSGIDNSVSTNIAKLNDALVDKLNLSGVHLQTVADTIKNFVQGYIEAIRKIRGTISQYQSEAIGALSNIIITIDEIIDSPIDILNNLMEASTQLLNVIGFGVDTIYGGTIGQYTGERRGNVTELNGENIPEEIGTSYVNGIIDASQYSYINIPYVQNEQEDNVKLMLCYNKITLMAVISRIAIRINYNSKEIAIEYKNKIKSAMEDVLLNIGDLVDLNLDDNQIYDAMNNIKNSFLSNFEIKILSIANSIEYTVAPNGMSTLQIAYDLYNDLNRDIDIYNRNKSIIKNPSFCPGGEVLKVLDA